jgi:hypothetical protein
LRDFFAGEPWATGFLVAVPLREHGVVGLTEIGRCRADAIGDRLELVDVEAVEVGLVATEDLRGLVDGDVPEPVLRGEESRSPT